MNRLAYAFFNLTLLSLPFSNCFSAEEKGQVTNLSVVATEAKPAEPAPRGYRLGIPQAITAATISVPYSLYLGDNSTVGGLKAGVSALFIATAYKWWESGNQPGAAKDTSFLLSFGIGTGLFTSYFNTYHPNVFKAALVAGAATLAVNICKTLIAGLNSRQLPAQSELALAVKIPEEKKSE